MNNGPALVQIMAWRRPGDKPLSEPMMVTVTDAYGSLGLTELKVTSNGDFLDKHNRKILRIHIPQYPTQLPVRHQNYDSS